LGPYVFGHVQSLVEEETTAPCLLALLYALLLCARVHYLYQVLQMFKLHHSACGLSSLETAANSYITLLPGTKPSGAAFRLQFSQAVNGIAAFGEYLVVRARPLLSDCMLTTSWAIYCIQVSNPFSSALYSLF